LRSIQVGFAITVFYAPSSLMVWIRREPPRTYGCRVLRGLYSWPESGAPWGYRGVYRVYPKSALCRCGIDLL